MTVTASSLYQELQRGMDAGLHVGAQVYVSRAGAPVADFAIGDREVGAPMQPDTLVCWLSASKPLTALAVAQLFEEGAINLDGFVARYVPGFEAQGKSDITLRHLLTHTAGLRKVRFRFPEDDWQTIIKKICEAAPEWPAGEKAAYHPHTSWFILAEVVQRVTEKSISQYVRDHLLAPLEMHDTHLGMAEQAYDAYVAGGRLGQIIDTSRSSPRPHVFAEMEHVTMPKPGGNAFGPMRELGRLYEMLLQGGQLDGPRVLEPETIELFTAPQRMGMYDHTFQHTIDWGLGFICDSKHHVTATDSTADANVPYGYGPHASSRTFGHSGWQSCAAFCDPQHQLVVALHLNGTPGEKPHYKRVHQILGTLYEELELK